VDLLNIHADPVLLLNGTQISLNHCPPPSPNVIPGSAYGRWS